MCFTNAVEKDRDERAVRPVGSQGVGATAQETYGLNPPAPSATDNPRVQTLVSQIQNYQMVPNEEKTISKPASTSTEPSSSLVGEGISQRILDERSASASTKKPSMGLISGLAERKLQESRTNKHTGLNMGPPGGWTWTPADNEYRTEPLSPVLASYQKRAAKGSSERPNERDGAGVALAKAWGMDADRLRQTSRVTPPQKSVPYRYTPLTAGKFIRILELLPGKNGDDIEVQLLNKPLTKELQYTALSYEWGIPIDTKPVIEGEFKVWASITFFSHVRCGGKLIKVMRNLYDVLKHLRREDTARRLWIDGICIDQNNNKEKGSQVSMMREIYAFATEVILWMGHEEENTADAMRLVPELAGVWKSISSGKLGSWKLEPAEVREHEHLLDSGRHEKAWLGLRNLFSRPYFTRIWIVQEILTPQNASITCGPYSCTWDDFRSAFNFVLRSNLLACVLPGADPREVFGPLIAINQINDPGSSEFENLFLIRLDQLLSIFLTHKVTDAKDRVYGMLGIMIKTGGIFTLSPLVADYGKSVQQVYQDATEWCINNFFSLSVLDAISSAWFNDLEDLPSWVPDFTTGRRKCRLVPDPANFLKRWERQYMTPLFSGTTMSHLALKFDMVTSLNAPLTPPTIPILLMELFWIHCLGTTRHPTGCTNLEAIQRTFVFRGSSETYGTEELDYSLAETTTFDDFANFAAVNLLGNFGLPQKLTGKEPHLKDIAANPLHGSLAHVFPDDVKADISILALRAKHPRLEYLYACLEKGDGPKFARQVKVNKLVCEEDAGRQLFTTQKGYVGLGPPAPHGEIIDGELFMKKGAGVRTYDVVAILAGSASVFILRPEEGGQGRRYRIVGDAYIYGVSDGLCFEGKEAPDMETIHIV